MEVLLRRHFKKKSTLFFRDALGKLLVGLVSSMIDSILGVPVDRTSSFLGILFDVLGSILDLIFGMVGCSVDILTELASMIGGWTLCIPDPNTIVQGRGISKPSNIGHNQKTSKLVNLEKVVGKGNRRRLHVMLGDGNVLTAFKESYSTCKDGVE